MARCPEEDGGGSGGGGVGQGQRVLELASLRQLLLPLLWPCAWTSLIRTLLLTVLPMQFLDLGLSYQEAGLLSAANGLGTVFGNVPAAKLNSRFGPRMGGLVEGCAFLLAALLFSLPLPREQWVPLALVATVIAGFAEALGILSRQTMLGAAVPSGFRGRASAAMGGSARLGCMLGPLLGGAAAHLLGVRAAFGLQGLSSLVHVAFVLLFVPHVDACQDVHAKGGVAAVAPRATGESLAEVARRHWRRLLPYAVFSLLILNFRKSRELLFALEGHERGLSKAAAGALASLSFFIDVVSFPLAGMIMDGVGRVASAQLGLALGVLALLELLPQDGNMAVFAVSVGLANGVNAGVVMTIGADISPADCRAQFLALYRAVGKGSDLLAPLSLGLLAGYFSMRAAVLSTAGLCALGVAWGHFCVQETLQRRGGKEGLKEPLSSASAAA